MINLDARLQAALSTISGTYLVAVTKSAERHYGLDADTLLKSIGLSKSQISSIESRIPSYYLFNLFRMIAKTTQDPSIGLALGQYLELKSFSILGYLLMNSVDVGEGIKQLLRYEKLANELSFTTYEETDDECILKWHCPVQGAEAQSFQEIIITGIVCISRSVSEEYIPFTSVSFEHPEPPNADQYESILKCDVKFGQEHCGIRFPKSVLRTKLKNADPLLSNIVMKSADSMLSDFDNSFSFVSNVKKAIFKLLPSGELSMENVASSLSISNRVIHNRLKKHSLTFNDLVDEVRRILALHYIADESVSLVDIGLLLGFADQSSFTRAFKRWQGETPGDYRKSLFVNTNKARTRTQQFSLGA